MGGKVEELWMEERFVEKMTFGYCSGEVIFGNSDMV